MDNSNTQEIDYMLGDTDAVAKALVALRDGTYITRNNSPNNERTEDGSQIECSKKIVTLRELCNGDTAWVTYFARVKYRLHIMGQIVGNLLSKYPGTGDLPDIDNVVNRAQSVSNNGYMAVQYVTTAIVNCYRFALQDVYETHVLNDPHKAHTSNMFLRVIGVINKLESITWHHQVRYCVNHSSSQELAKFKSIVRKMEQYVHHLPPTLRCKYRDTVEVNVLCIENTGLLARHAFQHIICKLKDYMHTSQHDIVTI